MKDYFSITDMAKMHNISRQTLIYYDKIGLFKPNHIDEHGYRHYSPFQIPFLREICFLKSIGIKLEDIKMNIENRKLDGVISLLKYHKEEIDKEIAGLLKIRKFVQQRLNMFSDVIYWQKNMYEPLIEEFPERKVIFVPYENEMCRQEMHITLMKAWKILYNHEMLPSQGFGTMFMNDNFKNNSILEGAGIFVFVPFEEDSIENIITLPAGKYACMYKYAMPYDTQYLYKLVNWINDNNYKITGKILDACFLDTTFYKDNDSTDFCQLQIPIEKI